MVEAIVRELELRKNYFTNHPIKDSPKIKTIYFGGGTPSLLSEIELGQILQAVHRFHPVEQDIEQTIECNPEDLSQEKLSSLLRLGFNRLSIGIQTFHDPILSYINRAHDSLQAHNSVLLAKAIGFENITVDLIYALPQSTLSILQNDLEEVIKLDVNHISAYCFTLEEKTAFGKWEKKKIISRHEEDFEKEQYTQLITFLASKGYEQYEISNFARQGHYSKHNTAYWFGEQYLGIGPGAHSFNGFSRQWNVSNNTHYIEKLKKGVVPQESEELTKRDRVNETLLTQLRTKWGVDLAKINLEFSTDLEVVRRTELLSFRQQGWLKQDETRIYLTESGKLLADRIVADLMV